jgi:hypothetical protein
MEGTTPNVASAARRRTLQQKDAPSEQDIAARAHEIFQDRGGTDGRDLDDWLEAENELSNGLKKKS